MRCTKTRRGLSGGGPLATGEAPAADPPVEWSESRNIRWKVAIPGHGSATPLVWSDRVFVVIAIPVGESGANDGFFQGLVRRVVGTVGVSETQRYVVLAIDRRDGRVVWERVALEETPHEGRHKTGSWASPSAVTDGEVLCAFFGSRGLYCYDMEGQPLWDHDFGDMNIRLGFGEGASPALHGDTIVVNWDHEDQSFISALDKRTGGRAVAHRARRGDVMGDAAHRRARRTGAGRHQCHQPRAELRPGDREAAVARRGGHTQRDPQSRRGRWPRVSDEWVSRQPSVRGTA